VDWLIDKLDGNVYDEKHRVIEPKEMLAKVQELEDRVASVIKAVQVTEGMEVAKRRLIASALGGIKHYGQDIMLNLCEPQVVQTFVQASEEAANHIIAYLELEEHIPNKTGCQLCWTGAEDEVLLYSDTEGISAHRSCVLETLRIDPNDKTARKMLSVV